MPFVISKSLSAHQADVIALIDDLRTTKNNSPIVYTGLTLDADPASRDNLNGKIVEISSKIALGITTAEMFWKDHNNVIHSWSTLPDYLAWLQGYAIAIAERNTNLYGVSWTKKADVMALTHVNDVVAYDIQAGW